MFGRKKPATGGRGAAAAETTTPSAPPADGPHDRSTIGDVREYYTELGYGHIDLGALVIGVPKGRDLNVALDPNGQPEFHVVTKVSRVIPRVFAAPKSAGQWRTMVTDMREQLEQQGADVSVVDGPWGRELVAEMPGAVFRAVGVDGHRWTAEVRIMATPELADQAAEEGREVFRHLMVNRGDGPMPVKEQLALTIPEEIQAALDQARTQLVAQQQAQAAQQQAQAFQQQMAAGGAGQQAAQAPAGGATAAQQAPTQPVQDPQPQNPAATPAQNNEPSAPPRRDGSAMDRLRRSDDL